MSDPVADWLKSLGAKNNEIHGISNRMDFICAYYGLIRPPFNKSSCKKIFLTIRHRILNNQAITRESFIALTLLTFEHKKKWDEGYIAFCRSRNFFGSQHWKNARLKALASGHFCRACGRKPKDGIILHVDHILPRSIYPELALEPSNLQILCEQCNLGKGNTITKRFV